MSMDVIACALICLLFAGAHWLHVGVPGVCAAAARIGLVAVVYDETRFDHMAIHHQGGAINLAIDQLQKDGVLRNDTLSVVLPEKDSFSQSDGVGNVVELIRHKDVDVILGSPSSRVSVPAAHLTSHLNFPHISWAANSYELSDKSLFTTFIRTAGPISEVGRALVTLFKAMDWQKIGFLYLDYGICSYTALGTRAAIVRHNLTEIQTVTYSQDTVLTDVIIDGFLRQFRRTSRIIFMCVEGSLRRFLLRACRYNAMCDGDFLFIYISLNDPTESTWSRGDTDDVDAKHAFRYLFYVSTAKYIGEDGKRRLEQFKVDVIERMSEKPWYSDVAKRNNVTTYRTAQYLYDATYFFGLWLNFTRQHNISVRDGRAMMEFSKDLSFPGLSGSCDFGENGDRIPYMWIYQFFDGTPKIVAIAEPKREVITETIGFRWMTSDGRPPSDTPRCGYFDELCPEDIVEENSIGIIIVLLAVLLVVMVAAGAGFTIRKRQIENAMVESIWKVNIRDLELQRSRRGQGSQMSLNSQQSASRVVTGHIQIGLLRGQEVVVRSLPTGSPTVLTRQDKIQLKTMRQLVHDNINAFVGATFNIASPCVLFVHCKKGSLQDILENDDIKLDSMLKFSMTMDVIQGMLYIHSSRLGYHGRLKSTNCLVDGRWMVKLTDYGLGRFLHSANTGGGFEHERYNSLLWTAPELLADPASPGTKKGDVYSFAIILHEIFYRQGAFAGNDHLTAKEIIEKVRNREPTPCRPGVFNDVTDVSSEVMGLMKMCWRDEEAERPSFKMIQTYFTDKIGKRNTNIVDAVLKRLEKYAANLENVIEERTQQVLTEKYKTDRLLYRMLPPSCADHLKAGEPVAPEMFDSCTVFVSDIVGFTSICSRSTPIEVVDLLNDLYCFFDAIIERHDAYKVETVGDAYLVVSGVPTRNGNLHAGIIADMSLDLSCRLKNYKMQHMPQEKLVVRIGVHTGPCYAGVVGLSMPKYCLFGDTINIASRMESSGEREKIHISEASNVALQILGGYITTFRGKIQMKGRGLMRTYWLTGRK